MSHLFYAGIRVSTWAGFCGFALVAYLRMSWRPLLPFLAWLAGFEIAYQAGVDLTGHHAPDHHPPMWVSLCMIAGSVAILEWTRRLGVRADRRFLVLAAVFFLGWLVSGFHVNGHNSVDFQPFAEAMNEGSKTAWAIAYLVPLVRGGVVPWWRALSSSRTTDSTVPEHI
jgi:hypothetical protein